MSDLGQPHDKVFESEAGGDWAGKQGKTSTRSVAMAFTSCVDHGVNIDPNSSVSCSNSICKFKLIAFLGNYSM